MEIKHSIKSVALKLGDGQHKAICPFCSHTRKKKDQKTLSLKVSNDVVMYYCWHCGEDGGVKFNDENKRTRRQPMEEDNVVQISTRMTSNWYDIEENNGSLQYLSSRGISKETADKAGVKFTRQYIGSVKKDTTCLVFPYQNKKGLYQFAKVRSFPDKGFSSFGKASKFYNIDNLDKEEEIIICEGEMDCLSFMEIGFNNSISIPHGAVMKVVDGKIDPREDSKFKFIWNSKEKLDTCKKVIIAMDNDQAGQAMEEEIARRIGKDKCFKIIYPKDCKDANEVLTKHGKEELKKVINDAIPYPVSGLYDAKHFYEEVDEIYENGIGSGVSTGYKDVDELYTIVEGQLTVVTGHPSSGKSEFVDQIMLNIAKEKGWKFGVCSFENEPRIHIAKLISKYIGKPFFSGMTPRISTHDLEVGKKFVSENFCFLYQADGSLSTLDSILERLKSAVLRFGIRGCVIDPYNYIAKDLTTSETDWISDMLTKLRVFAQAHGIHIWFVAHPTKMLRREDGTVPPPKGYDIAGSASFFSKSDVGLTVHRPKPSESNVSQIFIWKCRFSWVGQIGDCEIEYDKITSRYVAVSEASRMLKPKQNQNTYKNYYDPQEYKDIDF
tara:strand:+ start:689 stop:2515 length:1827 start_codon:yes stop_codon:yes gene_type:complete